MNFLENLIDGLHKTPETVVLQEVYGTSVVQVTSRELLDKISIFRGYLKNAKVAPGDRCVLLAPNGFNMVAADIAIMAEGVIKVPMYTRQAIGELITMMQDCSPALVICGEEALKQELLAAWRGSLIPSVTTLETILAEGKKYFSSPAEKDSYKPNPLKSTDDVCIIYTSGTSGVSKGVVLTVGNLNHMLPCTSNRMSDLMQGHQGLEKVFHYLPLCFAGSWILLLSSLSRGCLLTLCTDLDELAAQMKVSQPHYFLNVPMLLDRIRRGVKEKMQQTGGVIEWLFNRGMEAGKRRRTATSTAFDRLWYGLAERLIFGKIRMKISPNLRALICGSAPLSVATQEFFEAIGIPVLQVYGLTETTAICTMDQPQGSRTLGRVGHAVPGIEMKLGDEDEILVRGPHIFPRYWNREEDTNECMKGEWFQTGDIGDVDAAGSWRIVGRKKNVIVLSSGHNVAPDPIEERLKQQVPNAEQVVVVGHERQHLVAVVTGEVERHDVDHAVEVINEDQPHYKKIRKVHIQPEPFSIDGGTLTANGKLKRQKVLEELGNKIEEMYSGSP